MKVSQAVPGEIVLEQLVQTLMIIAVEHAGAERGLILCVPLVKQARLMGVLYLENNLTPGVFTPNRLGFLELLASQAAISLDHARLYADLIQENNERRKAEEALRASEERWSVLCPMAKNIGSLRARTGPRRGGMSSCD